MPTKTPKCNQRLPFSLNWYTHLLADSDIRLELPYTFYGNQNGISQPAEHFFYFNTVLTSP